MTELEAGIGAGCFDPWTHGLRSRTAFDADAKVARTEVIDGVVPLDRQLGIWPKKSVPEVLANPLFGPIFPGSHTYALIDAALVDGLAERLENTGLPYSCLYQGRAQEQWGHVAPWLIRLEADHRFTRTLFSNRRGHGLWDLGAAIFMRTQAEPEAMNGFLRKLTRFRGADGRWMEFRFWTSPYLARYIQGCNGNPAPHIEKLLAFMTIISPEPWRGRVTIMRPMPGRATTQSAPSGIAPDRWPNLHRDLAKIRYDLFLEQLDRRMCREIPDLAALPEKRRLAGLRRMADNARKLGLSEKLSVERYVISALLMGHPPEKDPRCRDILAQPLHGLDKSKRILSLAMSEKH